jgi:glycogen operon protein
MPWYRALALMFNGRTLQITDEDGHPIVDDSFLILVNAAADGVEFKLPATPAGTAWTQVLDTENIEDPFAAAEIGEKVILGGRSLRVFRDSGR